METKTSGWRMRCALKGVLFLAFISFTGGKLTAESRPQLPPYSSEGLVKLAKAVLEETIDQLTAENLISTRNIEANVDVDSFVKTTRELREKDVPWSEVEKIEEMLKNVQRKAASPAQAEESAFLQPSLAQGLTNAPASGGILGTNLILVGTNIHAAGLHIAEHGARSSLLGTNASEFGTNLVTIGNELQSAGKRLTSQRASFLPHSELHFGLITLNPYQIHVQEVDGQHRAFMESDDTSSRLLVEFTLNNRWAWKNPFETECSEGFESVFKRDPLEWTTGWDFQGRISFSFFDSNGDGAAILGAGDLYSEITLGKHLARWARHNQAHSVNVEGSYGAVTDRKSLDLHARILAGLSYNAAFENPLTTKQRRILFSSRLGAAFYEIPRFVDAHSAEVVMRRNLPEFRMTVGYALESELFYPLSNASALTAGGRLYGNSDPNPWTVWVGYTKSIGQLLRATKSFLPGGDFEE
jgi:hypothetical protein